MSKAGILVIDDEAQMRKLLQITLESNGYQVQLAETGREGVIMAANHPPDLIILDLDLPDSSGHEVLKELRTWYTQPILMLTVVTEENDIIKALDSGANDYLVKPYRTGELLARVRNALRLGMKETTNTLIQTGNVSIDLAARTLMKANEWIKLTATEFSLLSLLARNHDRVLTHQYLLREVWGPGYVEQSQYLRVFIAQLRKKIEDDPNRPTIIITESGVGYRFVVNN